MSSQPQRSDRDEGAAAQDQENPDERYPGCDPEDDIAGAEVGWDGWTTEDERSTARGTRLSAWSPQILDACCGGRHWWWNKAHPLAVYMDNREAPQGSVDHRPNWECRPDVLADFRSMPYEDERFRLVLFDPPHIVRPNPSGRIVATFGALSPDTEQDDLRRGFAECWRVLAPGGTLVFKWGAGSIKRVQPHFPATPIVGTRSPRGGQTRWFIFYKPLNAAALEAVA